MSTTAPSRITDLAYNYRLDINTVADPGTGYAQLLGIEEAKFIPDLETTPDRTYDDRGAMREEVIGSSWRIEGKLKNSLNAAGTSRNVVHVFLRDKFLELLLLTKAAAQCEFGIRWYHIDGIANEAYEGPVFVKAWPQDGGQGQDTISFVLMGQGLVTRITNPASSQLPNVSGLSPSGGAAAGGTLVNIYGDHFTGVTGAAGVKFGANNATSYTLVHDGHIVAVAPAHAAGMVQTIVTTPAGASTDVAADDYTYV